MSHWHDELPLQDTHAHIAPDVTADQLQGLGAAQIFAMTRSLVEAVMVLDRGDRNITWGCGIHPAARDALGTFTRARLETLVPRFAVVGEVGLDGHAGEKERQRSTFVDVLTAIADQPVLVSIHSAGAAAETIEVLADHRHSGSIFHWFTGTAAQAKRALQLGAYMSVNAAMSEATLSLIPRDRILLETDYPSTERRGGGSQPGDTARAEQRLAQLWGVGAYEVRAQCYRNLRDIANRSGAIERLPEDLADMLLVA